MSQIKFFLALYSISISVLPWFPQHSLQRTLHQTRYTSTSWSSSLWLDIYPSPPVIHTHQNKFLDYLYSYIFFNGKLLRYIKQLGVKDTYSLELRQGHLFIAINVYRYVYFNTCLFFHWLTIPPAAVHPPEPRSPGTGPCRSSPSRCSTWTRRKPWLMTGEPSAHTSSLLRWSSTKETKKNKLDRPLPR